MQQLLFFYLYISKKSSLKFSVRGILLLLCLTVPLVTTLLVLQIQKSQVRKEVKWKYIAGMNTDELVKFVFSEKEKQTALRWEHSKEFEYRGEMYDVIKMEVKGDTTYYWCWWDHEETKLNKQIDKLAAFAFDHNPEKQEKENRLLKFFKSLFFYQPTDSTFVFLYQPKSQYFFRQHSYQSVALAPPLAPPKI
ncbi:MAG TPA: hypothetical protein PL009_01335 [Flavipsychrobacter sp.]|nr:hypothetical protein [Flavipsychrobacter sp.]